MSGGYLDYICFKLDDITDRIDDREIKDLIKDLADLLHDYEWWQSGDYGSDSYNKKLKKFKAKWFGDNRNERLIYYLNTALDEVKAEINKLL